MTRPRLLDLCCKAGGAARGYQLAGFHVVGVDVEPQPRFAGDEFVLGDALAFLRDGGARGFDAVHASWPCQAKLAGLGAANRALGRAYDHVDIVDEGRALMLATGLPYVIEQPMKGARLRAPIVYCGSSFGLPIHRHRQFESNVLLLSPACEHDRLREAKYWTGYGTDWGGPADRVRERKLSRVVQVSGNGGGREEWGPALGIDWMRPDELTQAIPPAYTQHIGEQLLAHVTRRAA